MGILDRFTRKRNKDPVQVWLNGDNADIFKAGYTTMDKNPEVLVCVDIIASLISSMTILLMQNQDDGDIRLNNELAKKIDIAPNKYMTRKNFMYKLVHTMLLEGNGNCVLTVDTVDGYIDNLNFLNMSKVRYVYNDNKYEIKYNNQTLYPDEVLHFVLRPSKESQFKGIGYVNELKNVVSDLAQQQATKNGFLKSKWKPSVILGVETDNIDMMDEEYREKLLESYGANTEAGKPWIVPAGEISAEVVKPLTLKDLAIVETMILDKKAVGSVFGIPPFMLGVGKFNKEEYDNFINGRILPIAQSITQELTKKILFSEQMYFKFNKRSLYKHNLKELAEVCDILTKSAIIDRNESRKWLDMSPREGLSELIMLENYIPFAKLGDQKKLNGGDNSDDEQDE